MLEKLMEKLSKEERLRLAHRTTIQFSASTLVTVEQFNAQELSNNTNALRILLKDVLDPVTYTVIESMFVEIDINIDGLMGGNIIELSEIYQHLRADVELTSKVLLLLLE